MFLHYVKIYINYSLDLVIFTYYLLLTEIGSCSFVHASTVHFDCCHLFVVQVYRNLHTLLLEYKDAKKGPTVVFIQSPLKSSHLTAAITSLKDFPQVGGASIDTRRD